MILSKAGYTEDAHRVMHKPLRTHYYPGGESANLGSPGKIDPDFFEIPMNYPTASLAAATFRSTKQQFADENNRILQGNNTTGRGEPIRSRKLRGNRAGGAGTQSFNRPRLHEDWERLAEQFSRKASLADNQHFHQYRAMSDAIGFNPANWQEFFHETASRGSADQALRNQTAGTFLLRPSIRVPGDLVLTVSEPPKVKHYLITKVVETGQFKIGEQIFDTMCELLTFYTRHLLDTAVLRTPLVKQCNGGTLIRGTSNSNQNSISSSISTASSGSSSHNHPIQHNRMDKTSPQRQTVAPVNGISPVGMNSGGLNSVGMNSVGQNSVGMNSANGISPNLSDRSSHHSSSIASEHQQQRQISPNQLQQQISSHARRTSQPFVIGLYDFDSTDPEDLPFKKGDRLEIIDKQEEQWWTARNSLGRIGHIPVPYIKIVPTTSNNSNNTNSNSINARTSTAQTASSGSTSAPPVATPASTVQNGNNPSRHYNSQSGMFYEAIMRRVPNAYDSQALALEVGDTIQVLEKRSTGQWVGKNIRTGSLGQFPFTHVKIKASPNMSSGINEHEV